jgi:hypothetical protein
MRITEARGESARLAGATVRVTGCRPGGLDGAAEHHRYRATSSMALSSHVRPTVSGSGDSASFTAICFVSSPSRLQVTGYRCQ